VPTLLLVEDDEAIAEPLGRALKREGYDVEAVCDGAVALERLKCGDIDVMVLDLGLPSVDGIEVCRRVRVWDKELPIVMLTARTEEIETVIGLDTGADDYVTKPFRVAELMARIRAAVRRHSAALPIVNGVRVDEASRRAWIEDRELVLTPKEFDLLALLIREAGNAVTREQIMSEVWDEHWYGPTKTLDMHISWLRRKLGDDAADPHLITTLRGVGFRFERA
jgi:DNA-binding response OmpR family regulator